MRNFNLKNVNASFWLLQNFFPVMLFGPKENSCKPIIEDEHTYINVVATYVSSGLGRFYKEQG
jgi:hypothetical protein